MIRALLDVDVRFDATVSFLLRTVDSLDGVDEDCSELSAVDGSSFDPPAAGARSAAFAAEAICFQTSAGLVIEFVSDELDDWSC